MPTFTGRTINLELQHVLHRLHIDEADSARNKPYLEALKQGIPLVIQKARPHIFYRTGTFSSASRGEIVFNGSTLRVGELVGGMLNGAHACTIGIATIGAGVEEASRDMKQRGLLHSFALEALGAIALDLAAEMYFRHMDGLHAESGEYLGVPLSPGETRGWPIEDQRTIYELVEEELVDVAITDSCLLIPKNSISFLVGIHDHPVKEENDSHCNYCSMRDTCLYRTEKP
jgi:hypothetical protein